MMPKKPYVSAVCLSNIPQWDEHTNPIVLEEERDKNCAGYVPRDYDLDPLCSHKCAKPFSLPLIDEQTAREMIEERERTGKTNDAVFKRAGLEPLNQGNTYFCWMNATIDAMHYAMLTGASNSFQLLSPAGAACWQTNFRNEGGNVSQAVRGICEQGAPEQSLWPANAIGRQYDTDEAEQNGTLHTILEYDDMKPQNDQEAWTASLGGFVIPYGNYNMGHAVNCVDFVITQRGELAKLCRNSGYLRGADGYSIMAGKYAVIHDACVIRAISIMSNKE